MSPIHRSSLLMLFEPKLIEGRLVKRYKRFLADVSLPDGSVITAHCPNTGAMTGCMQPGSRVWLRFSDNPRRKLAYTWELVESSGALVCIHSSRANGLVEEALVAGRIEELQGFIELRREARFGVENSRADFLLHFDKGPCYVEVKSVTLLRRRRIGLFPDTVSARGSKHLRELIEVKRRGGRAVLCFVAMHNAIGEVRPADQVDPLYGVALREAQQAGVELLAYGVAVSEQQLLVTSALPIRLCPPLIPTSSG
jgi:sugar fermentation stimulation protein A